MTTLFLATGNAHKIEEIRGILGEGFNYVAWSQFPNAPRTVEDAHSFAGNATKKAVELAEWIAKGAESLRVGGESLVLADDSGLEVDALDGAPGIYSARFANLGDQAGGNAPDEENRRKLLLLMKDVPAPRRTARFRCVIALAAVPLALARDVSRVCLTSEAEQGTQLFEGVCAGRIALEPRGAGGFSYDPLFIPEGHTESFAEIPSVEKNRISHRAKALEKLKTFFQNRGIRNQ